MSLIKTNPIIYHLLFILTLLLPSLAYAQSDAPVPMENQNITFNTITAIPPHVNLSLNPGDTIQENLKVKNDSEQEIILEAKVRDFIVTDNQGTPMSIAENTDNRWSLAQWVTVSPAKFSIKPKEVLPIAITITAPHDALPGGHYAMVTYEPIADNLIGQSGSKSKISQQVGTLINVVVAGKIKEDAQVVRLEPERRFSEYGPLNFTTEIINHSDIHISPTGSITITNMLNQTSATLPLAKLNIFPLTSRIYHNTFAGKWHLGRYQATLNAAYGNTGQTLRALVYFWIVPWKIILAVVTALALLIVGMVVWQRKSQAKTDELVDKKVKEILSQKNKEEPKA